MEMQSLITAETKIKVSSTLDKTVGKKYLTDGSPETCWTSQQGTPQYIQLSFPSPVIPKHIDITFQGGFAGTRCVVECQSGDEKTWRVLTRIYPEDVNRKQTFDVVAESSDLVGASMKGLRLMFEKSSDFFGRITVYDLHIAGVVAE